MNDQLLQQQLNTVGQRYRRLWWSIGLIIGCSILSMIGLIALVIASKQGTPVNGWIILFLPVAAFALFSILSAVLRRTYDPIWIAHLLEKRFPDLNSRLLTALEQKPDPQMQQLGYLQQAVVGQAVDHAISQRWESIVSPPAFAAANWGRRLSIMFFVLIVGSMLFTRLDRSSSGVSLEFAADTSIQIEPGDTSIERGTGMVVLARFTGNLPGQVELLTKNTDGKIEHLTMTKSLDDPVFAARLPSVNQDLQYAVRYRTTESKWYSAKVFEYPDLKQADANLKYPGYTNLPEKKIEDVRSITAVEGTNVKLSLRLNKPVAEAVLIPAQRSPRPGETPEVLEPIKLVADEKDPNIYNTSINLKQSQLLRVHLVDPEGRANKQPTAELTINVNPNRPPEMKPVTPGRDVDVSPIQELSTGVKVWDDFGVQRVGITYSMAGQEPQDVVLASSIPANERRDVAHLLSFEQFTAEPDQLLSYYFWAEDYAADGKIRRTSGDMYFAEVRPFEQIFRQGQQTSASEQQQQQQQQQQGNSNTQQAEQLAELQKQVIAATWKIIRRETEVSLSTAFAPDVNLIGQSQTSAREQASALEQNLTDAKSRTYLRNVLNHMDRAVASLNSAASGNALPPLSQALSSEQAAYQELLKLRAREFEVIRGNQQQNQQRQQSASSASSRRQQQLDQLQLDQEQNRYETQRAANPQQDNPQQRETRQVLNRLKELAQRQEDLNRQMREIQNALEQSRDQQQKEELQKQLARLRDQQQQQLRDTDELRDRMDQPENQERMAETRQQLEQTRENIRQASEALNQERLPEAAAQGARAGEQLNNLRDQVRRDASGQFAEAMNQMRNDARALDDNQQKLTEQLKQLDSTEQRSLRESSDRQQTVQQLGEQKKELDQLLENMRKTVDEAESTEPLLSRQLYETLRQTGQTKTDQALDVSRQLLERGFTPEARQVETEAAKGISKLREGVEQAASSVLGNESEALRRARGELDRLAEELQREVDRNRPAGPRNGSPATRPSGQMADARSGQSATRLSARSGNSSNPSTQPSAEQVAGGDQQSLPRVNDARQANQQRGENPLDGPQQAGGQPSRNRDQQDRRNGNPQQSPDQSQQAGTGEQQQPGENQRPGQSGQQANGPRPEQSQPGQNPGQGNNQNNNSRNQQPQQDGQQNPQLADAGQGRQQGQRGRQGDAQQATDLQQNQDPNQANGQTQNDRNSGNRNTNPNNRQTGIWNGNDRGGEYLDGPLTGDNFRDWSDRLRDVEEMVNDPQLRNRAARIRERARELRGESKRHSQPPNWDVVQNEIGQPLSELRDAVSQELLRHQSPEALVPLDREAVPPQYAEQVRQYYERLGGGR